MSKKTVFIIDDEVDFVLPLKDKLEASGYHVHEFYDGATALDALNRYKPDLILLDIIMPKINGYQAAMKIRDNEDFENVPIIMLSVKGEKSDQFWGKKSGATEYLVKPFKFETLLHVIKRLLGQ